MFKRKLLSGLDRSHCRCGDPTGVFPRLFLLISLLHFALWSSVLFFRNEYDGLPGFRADAVDDVDHAARNHNGSSRFQDMAHEYCYCGLFTNIIDIL